MGVRRLRSITGGKAVRKPERASAEELWEGVSSASTVEAFAAPYLELQCRMLRGAQHGLLVLGTPERGPFELAAVWPEVEAPPAALMDGAEQAIARRKGLIAGEASLEPPAGDPPRGASVVAHPIELGGKLHGAIVVQVDAQPEPQLRELLLQLRWGTGWLASLVRRTGTRSGSRRARLELVPNLLASALEYGTFAGAARAFVTELAMELGCDRVSIGFLRRGRAQLAAISHSSHAGKRTNLIRAIEAVMDEAIDQQATIVHPPPGDALPAGTQAHADLADQHGAGALCTVPVVYAGETCGALTLERPGDEPFDEPQIQQCEAAASLVGPLLEVMRRDDRWVVAKVWRALRQQLEQLFGPRHVALKLAAAAVVVGAVFFALVRGDYRVTADTLLEPAVLRAAVAPFGGYILEAPVRPGDVVREGELLGRLDDRELQLERAKWHSQKEQLEKQYRQALAERDAPKVEIFAASLEEARAELARIEDRLSHTVLRAPFAGVIISGDLSQQLGAPVEKGALLFEVAPLDAYRVILKVDETDVADVRAGQTGRIVFSSLPTESHPFVVEKVTPVAAAEEGRNYFRVEGKLSAAPGRLRPAMEGVAKIEIGRRRLIWIWTHDAIDWLRITSWKWLP